MRRKVMWIFGSSVGMADPAQFAGSTYAAANLLTLGMDLLAVLLLVALARPINERLPSLVSLIPSWCAAGLLLPVAGIFVLTAGGSAAGPVAGDGLRPWVYTTVYAGFTVQGVALAILICRYARRRWPTLGAARISVPPSTALLGAAVAIALVLVATVQFAWAAGVTVGLAGMGEVVSEAAFRVGSAVYGAAAICAVGGVIWLSFPTRTQSPRRRWWAAGISFFGTASSSMWGAYQLATVSVLGPVDAGPLAAASATRAVCGALLALIALSLLRDGLGAARARAGPGEDRSLPVEESP